MISPRHKRDIFYLIKLFFAFTLLLPLSTQARVDDCSTTVFSDGLSIKPLTFPAGGGYNTDAKVSLPMSANIGTTTVDLVPKTLIKTPYIWIPNTGSATVAQLRTTDGTLVKLYQNGADGIPGGSFVGNYAGGNGISRITLIPGGDVYIANRGSQYIIRLKPKPAPSEEYEYGGRLDMGAGTNYVRAVTFDKAGHVWGGTCMGNASDRIKVFCGSGAACGSYDTELAILVNGKCHYGAIGDKYGFVWTVSQEVRSYSYNSGTITEVATGAVPSSYGIGIGNDQTIWVGDWTAGSTGVYKVTRNTSGGIISILPYDSGLGSNSGVAADGLDNVWVAGYSANQVSRFKTTGAFVANYPVGNLPHGVAIDFDNNAWIVNINGGAPGVNPVLNPSGCGGGGSVTKLKSDGTYIGTYSTCGDNPYNYSDMTGFRSIPNSLTVGSTEYMPTTGNTYTGFGAPLKAALVACTCKDAFGVEQCFIDPTEIDRCLVPLSLFSVTGGDYEAKNLNIQCSVTFPDLTTGLVPCGRFDDNTSTTIDETQPCSICAMFYMLKNVINFVLELAVGIGVFVLVIAGLFYALAAGDTRKIESAKKAVTSAVIGIAIIFSAWLVIAVILQAMGYGNMASWNQITSC